MTKLFFGLSAVLLLGGAANAQITLSFTSNTINSSPGSTATFLGTISNASATDTVFLNGLAGSFDSANLNIDGNSFLTYAPISLAPNTSYTGSLFDVLVAGTALAGTYNGSVQLRGGSTDVAQDPLTVFQSIFVAVAVPEPGSMPLLLLGGLAPLALRRRSAS